MPNTDTKTALLDCAQDLIQRVGANAMSYNDLSEAVGIRKASIHYHFKKKEDLIVAILERCRNSYAEVYNGIVGSNKSAKEKLYMIADFFETNLRDGKTCVVGMLSVEFESLGPKVQEATQASIVSSAKIFERVFLQAVEEKSFSAEAGTYDAAYGFFCFLLGAQALSRCSADADAFRRSAKVYVEGLIQ